MNKICPNCKLANFANAENCIRCESSLADAVSNTESRSRNNNFGRKLLKRGGILVLVVITIIIGFYASLLISSDPLKSEDRLVVNRAIDVLDEKGFDEEVRYLRWLTSFRSSDNWLNAMVPKENAYAATNYPFEIMTVYPDFFTYAEDDTERAAILLHEAKHLKGAEEKEAYEFVWKNRAKLGWTKDRYLQSVLWRNVRKQTREYAPDLFICEFNEYNDCTENTR